MNIQQWYLLCLWYGITELYKLRNMKVRSVSDEQNIKSILIKWMIMYKPQPLTKLYVEIPNPKTKETNTYNI